MGEVARGLEIIEFACGIPNLLKGGFTEQASTGVDVYSIRQPLGVVAGITPFNFPAMVPMWMWAPALACGNMLRPEAVREGPERLALHRRAAEGGGRPRRRLQRRARRQGRGRPAARAPRRRRGQLRRLDADRPLHLRDGHEERQARAGARRRQEPHGRPARRRHRHGRRRRRQRRLRLGRRALHGRVASSSRSATSATRSSTRSRSGCRRSRSATGIEPESEMGPLITREHRDKVASYLESGREQGATVVADGRELERRRRRLLPRRLAARRRDARDGLPTGTRSSGRCSPSCASTATTKPLGS